MRIGGQRRRGAVRRHQMSDYLVVVPVTCPAGSSLSQRYRTPPSAPPISGASQNSQSCAIAQPPTNSAGPVLRAGLTEVLVIGMLTKWIRVRPRPIAKGA